MKMCDIFRWLAEHPVQNGIYIVLSADIFVFFYVPSYCYHYQNSELCSLCCDHWLHPPFVRVHRGTYLMEIQYACCCWVNRTSSCACPFSPFPDGMYYIKTKETNFLPPTSNKSIENTSQSIHHSDTLLDAGSHCEPSNLCFYHHRPSCRCRQLNKKEVQCGEFQVCVIGAHLKATQDRHERCEES